jgi:hypothetical protein
MGRASTYTDEIAERICERLIEGESLRRICAEEGMPDRVTVFRWLEKHEPFREQYVRARELQAEAMDDEILETARSATPETAHAAKVKISAFQWRASKLAPKKYGDKITTEHTGPGGGPIETRPITPIEQAKAVLALIAEVKAIPA